MTDISTIEAPFNATPEERRQWFGKIIRKTAAVKFPRLSIEQIERFIAEADQKHIDQCYLEESETQRMEAQRNELCQ